MLCIEVYSLEFIIFVQLKQLHKHCIQYYFRKVGVMFSLISRTKQQNIYIASSIAFRLKRSNTSSLFLEMKGVYN